jgi:POT family proton-dependent oligopeptide transporter
MSVSAEALPSSTKRHPPGLYLLFTTEMWERMSYYGMRNILTLFLVAAVAAGGLEYSKKEALDIYGWYTGLVYLTPLVGGYLADHYLGQRKSVLIGGTLMMLGQFSLATPSKAAFFLGLALLIIGNGFFKPNISTMVGGLYRQGDARRDAAFTIFYMGINTGSILASAVCGTIGEKVAWRLGFASAGVGMALGLITQLLLGNRLLGDIGKAPSKAPTSQSAASAEDANRPLTTEEKDRVLVILILALFTIAFWSAFEQAGGLLNLYTDEKVNRVVMGWTVPTTWMQSVNPWFIVLLGTPFAALWSYLGARGKDPSIPTKMGLGLLMVSVGFVFMLGASREADLNGKAALWWVIATYLFHTMGELCLSPVGLSMVTKLAPKRFASLLMGAWFLSNAIANKLSGTIGSYVDQLGEFNVFALLVGYTAVAGVVLLALSPTLKRMMHGADEVAKAPAQENKPGDDGGAPALSPAQKSV